MATRRAHNLRGAAADVGGFRSGVSPSSPRSARTSSSSTLATSACTSTAPGMRHAGTADHALLHLLLAGAAAAACSSCPVPAPACATRRHQNEDASACGPPSRHALEATPRCVHGWTCSTGTCASPHIHRASARQNGLLSQARRTSTTHDHMVPLALAHAYCHYNITPARLDQAHSHRTPSTRPRRLAALCPLSYCPS